MPIQASKNASLHYVQTGAATLSQHIFPQRNDSSQTIKNRNKLLLSLSTIKTLLLRGVETK